jgi:UDP-N-acetylmuramoyl-tripeptide--D-alanyl-D-alanine ligase
MSKGTETTIPTQLVGVYNFANVMTAVAVGLHFGIGVDKIKQAISNYAPDNSRSQWLNRAGNKIILDAYNANPTSMRAAIINFAEAKLDGKMLWLGGMKEMGTEEQHEHQELVALVDKYSWEEVLLVGKEFNGLQGNHKWFENSQQAAEYIHAHNPKGKSILIKGSRGSKMELLLQAMPEN